MFLSVNELNKNKQTESNHALTTVEDISTVSVHEEFHKT